MAKDITRTDQPSGRRPVDLLDAMRTDLDRVFDRFERSWPGLRGFGLGPATSSATEVAAHLDVREEGDKLLIEADLPGVEEKDVSVTLTNGVLTIKGERKSERQEKKDNYHIAERSFGRFERSLRLPDAIDESKVEAKFEKGVLTVSAAKRPEAVKAERRIEIKGK